MNEHNEQPWKCAGCGKEAVGLIKPCKCPTSCAYRGGGPSGRPIEDATWGDPAADFARWVEQGPKLALAAGLYVGIKVYASEEAARKAGDIS